MTFHESQFLASKNYAIELTADLSPTLRPENKESMHHMGGAASESVYLYYEALRRYFVGNGTTGTVGILSFGFGMGYNELLTAIFFLSQNDFKGNLNLVSKEKDLFLYELFNSWLNDRSNAPVEGATSVFDAVYLGLQRSLPRGTMEVSIQQVKDYLREQLRAGAWRQEEAVVRTSDFKQGYDIVFYDAYSAKTNSDLWSEDFLDDFFKNKLNTRFVFSTYACTAVLKQVAKNNQCFFEKRDGFMGKRNSSMIYR